MNQVILYIFLVYLVSFSKVFGQNLDLKTTNFEGLKGEEVIIKSAGSEIVLVSFWATWCAACLDEIQMLHELQSGFKEKLIIYSVNLDEDKDKVRVFLKENKVLFPVLRSKSGLDLLKSFSGKEKLPAVVLFDKKLDFIASFSGKTDFRQINRILKPLLQ